MATLCSDVAIGVFSLCQFHWERENIIYGYVMIINTLQIIIAGHPVVKHCLQTTLTINGGMREYLRVV